MKTIVRASGSYEDVTEALTEAIIGFVANRVELWRKAYIENYQAPFENDIDAFMAGVDVGVMQTFIEVYNGNLIIRSD